MSRNINLPKRRIYIRKDAWGGPENEWEPAWLISVRALRNRPLCFQVWVDSCAACYDKIPPHCLYWKEPQKDHKPFPLHKIQMWECLSGDIELFIKEQLLDVPVIVNMGNGNNPAKGRYWFSIDSIPERQGLGYPDVGNADLLEEHKEMNVVKLSNGQIAVYPNNRLKWCPESLTTEEAIKKIPDWKVAENTKWDEWWLNSDELFGESDWAY